ncbi:hypothetical protein FM107_13950 [Sphingobacterium sp. JB170]|nr:hypothetical protein FM107_13950 [Sphingobacterium sp. JB170]
MIKDEYTGHNPNTELSIHVGSVVSVAGVVSKYPPYELHI